MQYSSRFLIFVSAVLFAAVSAFAHEYKTGDLLIDHPVIPSTVKSAPVAAGYLRIFNSGQTAERLVSVRTGFSAKSSIHEMKMVEGVMKMRPLAGGIKIPAGESVVLKKGGEHLMFMKLREQMEVGQLRKVILTFEKAGEIVIEMEVVDPADLVDGAEKTDHSTL